LRERLVLSGHEGSVISAAFSPDGKRIVTASLDRTARLWDTETGKPIGELLTGHAEGVTRAAVSPDGKRIVTASSERTRRREGECGLRRRGGQWASCSGAMKRA